VSRVSVIDVDSENARLAVLHSYGILDSQTEGEFDEIVLRAARELRVPVAVLALVDKDRVWFKAQTGLKAMTEIPREQSFCQFAFSSSATFVLPDARADARFASLPMVAGENGFRFYSGAPLRAHSGHAIGTLCVLDTVPRQPTARDLAALRALADRAMALLELRRSRRIQASSFAPFPVKTEPTGGAGRLLVVEDDDAVREFVCTVTRQLGYAVTEAANGAEALSLVQNNPGAIELVLTDVNMPVMDGLELVRSLKKLSASPRIAVMSGRFDSQIRAALRAAGVAVMLAKPFSLVELELSLQQARAQAV
jgi:CheY-like chemotaxis protein